MPACPECGSDVDPSDRFCTECGRSLDDVEEESEEADSESQGPDRVDVPADPHELDVFEFSFKYPLANGLKPIALAGLLLGAFLILLGLLFVAYRTGFESYVLAGLLLLLGSFLIPPGLLFVGYQYRVGRSAAVGQSSPPDVEDLRGLLTDGFRLLVVVGLAAAVVLAVSAGLIRAGFETLAFAWNFFASICMTALLPVFYGTGSVRGVYEDFRFVRFVGGVTFWIGYAYQLGIGFVLYLAFFVASFVLFITVVGILPWFPFAIGFAAYASLVQTSLWGRIYRDAAQEGDADGIHEPDRIPSRW